MSTITVPPQLDGTRAASDARLAYFSNNLAQAAEDALYELRSSFIDIVEVGGQMAREVGDRVPATARFETLRGHATDWLDVAGNTPVLDFDALVEPVEQALAREPS